MKSIITQLLILFSLTIYSQPPVSTGDLQMAVGSWEGKITYLDYQTNKPFTMAANLLVEQGRKGTCLILNNIYPNEPKANNTDKVRLTKKGTFLNKHLITKREKLDNGQLQIQTEHKGKDDHKKALIRYTYQLGNEVFIIKKEVQFNEGEDWIKRSELNYRRKL